MHAENIGGKSRKTKGDAVVTYSPYSPSKTSTHIFWEAEGRKPNHHITHEKFTPPSGFIYMKMITLTCCTFCDERTTGCTCVFT